MSDVIISVEDPQPHTIPTEKDDGIVPHNGNPITRLEISPNVKYLITYSDDHSIVGWDVKDINEKTKKERLKPDNTVRMNKKYEPIQICVSDDRKLACIYIYKGWNYLSK